MISRTGCHGVGRALVSAHARSMCRELGPWEGQKGLQKGLYIYIYIYIYYIYIYIHVYIYIYIYIYIIYI